MLLKRGALAAATGLPIAGTLGPFVSGSSCRGPRREATHSPKKRSLVYCRKEEIELALQPSMRAALPSLPFPENHTWAAGHESSM
eukprot:Skav206155  [mRNA]  locus=scaffold1545:140268:141998:+ [translate_table: standard]